MTKAEPKFAIGQKVRVKTAEFEGVGYVRERRYIDRAVRPGYIYDVNHALVDGPYDCRIWFETQLTDASEG